MSSDVALEAGEIVDRYTVEGPVGRGGVASVYKVRHNTLGSVHALKVLRLNVDTMKERLVQEGQLQAILRHKNIVAVTDIVDIRGTTGLVMDFIEGPSLRGWLRHNQPELPVAEAIFRGILAGVARAHRHGMVHRDLKPENVLMATGDDGELVPKVADFGLAKMLSPDDTSNPSLTRTGTTMGTPAYMAPEQVRDSSSVDQRADMFALGCMLYELCTGVSPFEHPDVFVVFNALASGSYAPPQSLAPDIPERIDNAIIGCLAVDPNLRIDSCAKLSQILDGAEGWTSQTFIVDENHTPDLVPQESTPPQLAEIPVRSDPVPKTRTRLRLMGGVTLAMGVGIGLIGLAMVVVVVGGVLWMGMGDPQLVAGDRGSTVPEPSPTAAPGDPAPPEPGTQDPSGTPGTPDPPGTPPGTEDPPGTDNPSGTPDPPDPSPVAPTPQPAPAAPSPPPSPSPSPSPQPASPQPAPTVAPAPAAGPTGTVNATGDADRVWLVGGAGRVAPGVVPTGDYKVLASFKGEAPMPAGTLTVQEGQTITLSCSADFQMCQPK